MLKYLNFRLLLLVVSLVAAAIGYRLMFLDHVPVAWSNPAEDMSFARFVPLFSVYVLYRELPRIRAALGEPSAWGLLPLAFFLFVGFLGIRGHQVRFEIVGFAGLIFSLVWSFYGWRAARLFAFPCAFLLFCMPLATYLDIVTVHLRLMSVSVAYGTARGLGIEIVRQGTMLTSPTGAFSIDVASPCSGIRSLFALMALTAGYAYFNQPTWFRRGLLFALSIPLAVVGNVARILSIVLVAAVCDASFATGFYHDYSGYVVFAVAVLLMVSCAGAINWVSERMEEKWRRN